MFEKFKLLLKTAKQVAFPNSSRPLFLICFVTNDCNYRCKHCFIDDLSTHLDQQLSTDEWIKISQNTHDTQILLFTGGEPFLRDDFWKIVISFYKNVHPKHILIATNGSRPEEMKNQLEKILPVCGRSEITVGISLDGDEVVHDEIRRKKGAYSLAENAMSCINELKRKYPNLSLNINTTFCQNNQSHLESFLPKAFDEVNPDGMSLSLIRGKSGEISNVSLGHYVRVMEFIHERSFFSAKAIHRFFGIRLSRAKAKAILSSSVDKRRFSSCMAGRLIGVIKHQGDVFPCETRSDLIGNLRSVNYNLDRLWFSEKNKSITNHIERIKCHCTHECFVSTNITFNPRIWPKIFLTRNIPKNIGSGS